MLNAQVEALAGADLEVIGRLLPFAVVVHDFRGDVIYANAPARALFGFEAGGDHRLEPSGRVFVDQNHAELGLKEHPASLVIRKRCPLENMSIGLVTDGGAPRWLSARAEPVVDADGDLDRVVVVYSEATADARTPSPDARPVSPTPEVSLPTERDEQAELLKAFARVTDFGILLLDGDGRGLFANSSFAHLMGQDPTRLQGQLLVDGLQECGADVDGINNLRRALHERTALVEDLTAQSPTGEKYWLRLHVTPVSTAPGRLGSFVVVGTDVTESKQTRERLTAIAEAREAELSRQNTFFSLISHDLRSPFTTMNGLSKLMIAKYDDLSDDERKDFIGRLHKNSATAYALVDNLLTWAASNSGALFAEPDTLDVRDQVRMIMEEVGVLAQEKNVKLDGDAPENLEVLFDQNMFQTILRNLFSNAVAFSEPNKGVVRVRVCETPNGTVAIDVEDNGIGMPPSLRDGLFQPGERVGRTGTGGERGSGIGLILSKDFAEQNGATLSVESTVDKGSTFRLTVRTQQEIGLQDLRVLVLDDDPEFRFYIQHLLRGYGIEPEVFSEPGQAIEAARSGRYHVVLVDAEMPMMTGFEVVSALKEHRDLFTVIGMSNRYDAERAADWSAAGADGWMAKEFLDEHLEGVLEAACAARASLAVPRNAA